MMPKFILLHSCLLILCCELRPKVEAHNILFALSFSSRDHKNVMDPIMAKLLEKGHQITVLGPFSADENLEGVTTITLQTLKDEIERNLGVAYFEMSQMPFVYRLQYLVRMNAHICNTTFLDPEFQAFLKNNDHKFDLVVVDAYLNEYMLALAHRFGAPSVYIAVTGLFPATKWNLNVPFNPIAFPSNTMAPKVQLTYFRKLIAVTIATCQIIARDYFSVHYVEEIVRKFLPNTPPLLELERNVSFVISNTLPTTTGVQPSMPFMAEIGGVNCHPAKKLHKEFETMVNQSGENGFIYFSLGSIVKSSTLPEEIRLKFIEVFKILPETVLWKFEKPMEDAPPNVKIQKWMPQQDLLARPRCKLFITHGGVLNIQEGVYHGVPLLVLPLTIDQHGNAAHVADKGYGDELNYQEFTVEEGVATIRRLIDDPKYRKMSQDLSVYLKDHPMPPDKLGAYWIEYVIRHKGAPHLKPELGHLNVFQYLLLDVIGSILAVVLAIFFAVLKIGCFIWRRLSVYIKSKLWPRKKNMKGRTNKKKLK